ncbi:MAG: Eco57I restriction-modification methylase domain-containing protein [Spirosomataceae bacterium]
MNLKKNTPQQALNKAFLKVKPNRLDIERFKVNLVQLLDGINETASEEFHKNLVIDFLKKTYYDPSFFINTKENIDLAIHNGNKPESPVGVLIEAKKPTNKLEMVTKERLNAKALQELVLYYLRERILYNNLEIKHLAITNINEWFLFDAQTFDRLFAQNKGLVQQFKEFEKGRLAETKTDFFYKQIAEPFIASIVEEIEFTYFNLQQYRKFLSDESDVRELIALFKLLSPEHLLKLPFANDSNSLDKRFYSELLHIIGLTETKEGGKKLIERNQEGKRHSGTLIEDTIIQLDSLDKISRLDKPTQYGATHQERLFQVALELAITWVNRILFLKLLEAQLITYHKGDKQNAATSFAFLNTQKIKTYDDLNSLFFQVLARTHADRNEDVKKVFEKVPYLNSSLFEPTEMEQVTLFISNLKDDKAIPVYPQTVLKDTQGKRQTGTMPTLHYLFAFLDAYDFGAEGGIDIQEENKSLINASVLGLIFEKINGYKDGSFFTPGFITMYMCRETIRKAVVQKLNEAKGWNCQTFDELKEDVQEEIRSGNRKEVRKVANEIISSIKIVDPAVGSGHFLVSALNELIAIKSELKILVDANLEPVSSHTIEVVNDELVVTNLDGALFEYNPYDKESQRIQETLFHEKQRIIENCLFGVDLNPNSVKICRLRLWIELLKNAYYKTNGFNQGTRELETLPNIDINIKCGNSLVSRFALDTDLKQALRKGKKWTIESYKIAIDTYRNAENKEQKREMERLIADIKSDFRSEISRSDPKMKRKAQLAGELYNLTMQQDLFEESPKDKKLRLAKIEKVEATLNKLEDEIEEIKTNKIYDNAFEWRFEFPDVLNDDGDFVGFDVVIGNPPYITGSAFKEYHTFFNTTYLTAEYQLDLYTFFIELSNGILKSEGHISLITPNSWLKNLRMLKTRRFILDKFDVKALSPNIARVFDEASVDTLVFIATKCKSKDNSLDIFDFNSSKNTFIKSSIYQNRFLENDNLVFDVEVDESVLPILKKIRSKSNILEDKFEITRGVNPYDKYRGQTEEVIKTRAYHSSTQKDDTFVPELKGKHVSTFQYKWDNKHFISYGNWLAAPREPKFFKGSRLVFREIIGERFVCTVIEEDFIIDRSLYIALPKDDLVDIYYVLGILCSKLLIWLFKYEKNEFDDLFPKIRLEEFKKLPIPKLSNYKSISILSKEVLILKQQGKDTTDLESQIDQLVYQLYELTEEEIKIIEKA